MKKYAIAMIAGLLTVGSVSAQEFTKGPLIKDFGENAPVNVTMEVPKDMVFKGSFDIASGADAGHLNRALNSPARLLNMMVRHGIDKENVQLALVIHGGAALDVTNDNYYKKEKGIENVNAKLIQELVKNGVRVVVCGQSAASRGISNDDLLPGVEMALSAMTAHMILENQGYKPIMR